MHIVGRRRGNVCLVLALLALSGVADAESYRGKAVPVAEHGESIELLRLRFLTFAFGHEGPMDAPLPTPPVAGREYFVEADVHGIESVASIRFELVAAAGGVLQPLTMWKGSDGSSDDEFYGFVTVPDQPFRAAVSGTDTSGAAFRFVLDTVFQPAASGPPDEPILPPGIPANESGELRRMVAAYRQELTAHAARAAAEHPGGLITLARAVVSRIAYEPLRSSSGAPIGVRLRYSMRFPSRRTIVAVPLVFPVYGRTTWRGVVAMKPLGGTITPAPEMVGSQSLRDVLVYRGAATYQTRSSYAFTVDMVPDWILQGTETGRFCIYEQKVTNRAVWDALMGSGAAVPYSVSIPDAKTSATIPAFFPQRTFHESFARDGALDCGPVPNVRF